MSSSSRSEAQMAVTKTIRHDHRILSSHDEDSIPIKWIVGITPMLCMRVYVCVGEACWGFAGSCVVSVV